MAHLDPHGGFDRVQHRGFRYKKPRSHTFTRRVKVPQLHARVGVVIDEAACRVIREEKRPFSGDQWIVNGHGMPLIGSERDLAGATENGSFAGASFVLRMERDPNRAHLFAPAGRGWYPVAVLTTRDVVTQYHPRDRKELLHTDGGRLFLVWPGVDPEHQFQIGASTYGVVKLRDSGMRIRVARRG